MTMDVSMMAVDIGQYPEQANLQSFISNIKRHNLLGLKVQIGASTVATNEASKTVSTKDLSKCSSKNWLKSKSYDDIICCPSDKNARSTMDESNLLIRAKSLRSALTTSRTQNSGRRKKVQFADAFGLNLVHQNYYDADDDFAMKLENFGTQFPTSSREITKPLRNIILSIKNFEKRTNEEIGILISAQTVCLQNVELINMNIIGLINVLNIAYRKQVYVRYTADNWTTQIETTAKFKSTNRNDNDVDKFTFIISLPSDFPVGATCEFCIRYIANDITYWDNNNESNYIVQAVQSISSKWN